MTGQTVDSVSHHIHNCHCWPRRNNRWM